MEEEERAIAGWRFRGKFQKEFLAVRYTKNIHLCQRTDFLSWLVRKYISVDLLHINIRGVEAESTNSAGVRHFPAHLPARSCLLQLPPSLVVVT